MHGSWQGINNVPAKRYRCGHCDSVVVSAQGWNFLQNPPGAAIHICPNCNRPTYFEGGAQQPGIPFGTRVDHVPANVDALYGEARMCTAAGAHTAAVLTTRKLLMNIAVDQGAKPGGSFMEYVEFLAANRFVPPHGRIWVDHIRKKGNEANHEIAMMSQADAQELLVFLEMLLKFIYEFPKRIPAESAPPIG